MVYNPTLNTLYLAAAKACIDASHSLKIEKPGDSAKAINRAMQLLREAAEIHAGEVKEEVRRRAAAVFAEAEKELATGLRRFSPRR